MELNEGGGSVQGPYQDSDAAINGVLGSDGATPITLPDANLVFDSESDTQNSESYWQKFKRWDASLDHKQFKQQQYFWQKNGKSAFGYTLKNDYATGTNKSARFGSPLGSFDVTAIDARVNASFGPAQLTSQKLPTHGEIRTDQLDDIFSPAKTAFEEIRNKQATPALSVSKAQDIITVNFDSIGMIGNTRAVLWTKPIEVTSSDTNGGMFRGNPDMPVSPPRSNK